MIFTFKEQELQNYILPSFTIEAGQSVLIELPQVSNYYEIEASLLKVLEKSPFGYAGNAGESRLKKWFSPITVGQYIEKYIPAGDPIRELIYTFPHTGITPHTKLSEIWGGPLRLLGIAKAFATNKNIIISLRGGISADQISIVTEYIKTHLMPHGTVILIDCFPEYKEITHRAIKAIQR